MPKTTVKIEGKEAAVGMILPKLHTLANDELAFFMSSTFKGSGKGIVFYFKSIKKNHICDVSNSVYYLVEKLQPDTELDLAVTFNCKQCIKVRFFIRFF